MRVVDADDGQSLLAHPALCVDQEVGGDREPRARFVRFVRALDTSMGTAEIVTDAGRGYIKALGNRQGPHALACQGVATQLARWFGLPSGDFSVLKLDETDEIPYAKRCMSTNPRGTSP